MQGKEIDDFLGKLPEIDGEENQLEDQPDKKPEGEGGQQQDQQSDLQIEIEEDGGEEDSDQQQDDGKQQPQRRQRKGNDFQSRMRKVNSEKNEAIDFAARVAADSAQKDAEIERLRRYTAHLENATLEQLEIGAKAQKENAKQQLIKAKQDGDPEKEAEATALLTEADAHLARITEHKLRAESHNAMDGKNNRQQQREEDEDDDQPQRRQQSQRPQQRQELPLNTRITQGWMAENSWFNPRSDDYDQEMASDVQKYAQNLEKAYKDKGLEHKIGGYEYFRKVDSYRAQKWGLFEDEDEGDFDLKPQQQEQKQQQGKRPQMRQANDGVGPQQRNGDMAQGNNQPRKTKVTLSALERDIALSVFSNLTDPKTGQPLSDQQKLALYYKNKMDTENVAKDAFQKAELRKAGIKI